MPDPLQQRCTVNNCSFVKLKVNAGERCNVDNGGGADAFLDLN